MLVFSDMFLNFDTLFHFSLHRPHMTIIIHPSPAAVRCVTIPLFLSGTARQHHANIAFIPSSFFPYKFWVTQFRFRFHRCVVVRRLGIVAKPTTRKWTSR